MAREGYEEIGDTIERLEAQKAELLEALQRMLDRFPECYCVDGYEPCHKCQAETAVLNAG